MEFTFTRKLLPAVCLGMALGGCIDDNYDLSDIDTTVRVTVDDLVVPINLNDATLKSILNMDPEPEPDSKIQVVNGQYAFVQDGDFSSDAIIISEVKLPEPVINATVTTISLAGAHGIQAKAPAGRVSVDLPASQTHLSTETYNVSPFIVSVDKLGTEFNVGISLSIPELAGVLRTASFEGLTFKLPKGLAVPAGTDYDPATGIFKAGSVALVDGQASVSLFVAGIDCKQAGVEYDSEKSHIKFTDDLGITAGALSFDAADLAGATLPASCTLTTGYKLGDILVTSFTGSMKYTIDGFSISDVTLNDLPDVLSQQGTDLRIANPQIYFSVNNPLAPYSVKAQTGFEITSFVGTDAVGTYDLDEPFFTITGTPGKDLYSYYLSPAEVAAKYPGYDDAEHVGYKELSDVLSGHQIPDRLRINFLSPCVPAQPVKELPLGVDLGIVGGDYVFCAPLAFAAGAKIVYSDIVDGWGSEDLDALTIEALDITATVTSELPVGVHFTGYPIDDQGHQINGVEIEGADIDALAAGQPLHIRITGEITHLDGICFRATVATDADTEALKPDMTIRLADIRPRVSGYYTKEL